MKTWGWRTERERGFWQFGLRWLKPAAVAVPWITVGLLLIMLHMVGGSLTIAEGVVFDLPQSGLSDGERTQLVALAMPMPNAEGICVFFDDARYILGNDSSVAAFSAHLADRAAKTGERTLLVLADKSLSCANLTQIASVSKQCGLERILFANKRREDRVE